MAMTRMVRCQPPEASGQRLSALSGPLPAYAARMARLGILLSGNGSTYENLARAVASGAIGAEIVVVVSSKAEAGGVVKARANGHQAVVASEQDAVTAALRAARVDWIAMCGWMRFWDPPRDYAERTLNIHPSLLPAFGGKGMYGLRVHQAVLAHGCKITGCTAHLVTGDYDSGPIVAQSAVAVREDDSAESLRERVQAAERELYPRVVAAAVAGRLRRGPTGWWMAGA
jgi:phosphoribosylglycinamide formyltransferase-1